MEQYGPVALLLAMAGALGGIMLALTGAFGPKRPTVAKLDTYECGVVPVGNARTRFPVRYYLVALVFVVFDLEAVFIYPWAVSFRDMKATGLGMLAFGEMATFMGVLLVGLVYLWRRGALDWE